jgi:hypothetical protein
LLSRRNSGILIPTIGFSDSDFVGFVDATSAGSLMAVDFVAIHVGGIHSSKNSSTSITGRELFTTWYTHDDARAFSVAMIAGFFSTFGWGIDVAVP